MRRLHGRFSGQSGTPTVMEPEIAVRGIITKVRRIDMHDHIGQLRDRVQHGVSRALSDFVTLRQREVSGCHNSGFRNDAVPKPACPNL